MTREQVFTLEATPLKYGRGAAADAGWELQRLGVKRAMLVSDPGVAAAGITGRVRESVEAAGISVEVWDRARVEPTDESFGEAAAFAVEGGFDGFVGIGGGSSIDTAKVSDLIATHGGEIMDYVNAPVGEGRKPPGPLKPLLADPDHLRLGRRGDHRGDPRHPRAAREDAGSRIATCGPTRRSWIPS